MQKEIEMMRVLRVPPLGKLIVEVGGERLQSLSAVNNPQVRQRLLAAIGELITFAGGYKALVDAGVAPALASPAASQPKAAEEAPPLTEAEQEKQRERFLNELQRQRDMYQSPKDTLAKAAGQPLAPPPIPVTQLTIVEQIDAILQKHVMADTSLANRSIHLAQNPSGGLRIEVDGKQYDRPREIEDPRIQVVIKKTLKEWETT